MQTLEYRRKRLTNWKTRLFTAPIQRSLESTINQPTAIEQKTEDNFTSVFPVFSQRGQVQNLMKTSFDCMKMREKYFHQMFCTRLCFKTAERQLGSGLFVFHPSCLGKETLLRHLPLFYSEIKHVLANTTQKQSQYYTTINRKPFCCYYLLLTTNSGSTTTTHCLQLH